MASAELSRRVEKLVGYPPLSEMGDLQRREFHEALLDADSFEDLPGKWQAAILEAEHNRPVARREQRLSRCRHRSTLSHARPAPRCECPAPRADDGTCCRCGHDLPALAGEVS
jgi:hypothetical protein